MSFILRSKVQQTFVRDARGGVAILFGLSVFMLMMVVMLTMDSARFYSVSDKLQQSLDSSALAGAKLLGDDSKSDSEIEAIANKYFTSAMVHAGVNSYVSKPFKVEIDRDTNTVRATAAVKTPSLFGAFTNKTPTVEIAQNSSVIYDTRKIEFSMVLDITGSMAVNSRIDYLKEAATDVIDQLFDDAPDRDSIRIALAPYSASVNAGSLASTVSVAPPVESCASAWSVGKGCQSLNGSDIDTCVIERNGSQAATDAAATGSNKLPNVPSLPYGNYTCPTSTVVPLMGRNKKSVLTNTINGYQAAGATAGHIGSAWGWYLLSPEWASVFEKDSKPDAYNPKRVKKAMLIMTDGEFNTSYMSGGTTDAATQVEESYTRFQALCAGAKAKDITIYTVGFALADARAINEMKQCATDAGSFFDAKDGAALKDAFKEIGERINSLRVSG